MARLWRKSLSPYESVTEARRQLAHPADFRRYAADVLDLLPVRSGSLLDVGCGLGWLVKEANDRGFAAVGVDPSRTQTRTGRENLKVSLTTTYPRGKFDVVIAKHVLEHVKKTDEFLKRVRNALKPSGYFLVACPNNYSLMHFIFQNRWYGLCPSQHVWQFTPESLKALLRRNGFKIERTVINSLDYQPVGIRRIIFGFLTHLANFLKIGDQVVVICRRR